MAATCFGATSALRWCPCTRKASTGLEGKLCSWCDRFRVMPRPPIIRVRSCCLSIRERGASRRSAWNANPSDRHTHGCLRQIQRAPGPCARYRRYPDRATGILTPRVQCWLAIRNAQSDLRGLIAAGETSGRPGWKHQYRQFLRSRHRRRQPPEPSPHRATATVHTGGCTRD